ncbi:NAD(P)/FAD-dependent oxidoreductase [Phycicoccus endophyticus]|uniref:NAD(P)/FAD-dependent oxidoreductase n=1 Tax=Phycicoccus endophyticus TaxID=1690220 RepID=A0A7G9QYH6_9MICO|nr:FAD/NAD(P)-binding oxidoreductase [Phycicoccus endophyticus]NHI19300.1 NAD(P)/FAD-dependent oxidoreductase [Phycicoccus endophyticus]QNN48401.1 NAD(P)/FAD-dependent oxidoreductase [Phycicoccus endophyticus]GGL41668.1 oxidoreductase [Phycicoccus endophyticus]
MSSTPKKLLVLGAGTAGTMVVNKLRRRLPHDQWSITVVDKDDVHDYQPGYLFIPFGINAPEQIRKTKRPFIGRGVEVVMGEIERVDAEAHEVHLAGGPTLGYDQLVIATGTTPRPDQTEGTLGPQWHREVGEFYTYDGALALHDQLDTFTGGRLVVHITEMPIKCPVAPLEFTFLADDWLRRRGLRETTELVFVTPLDGAFTKPVASRALGGLLEEKGVLVEPDFMVERIDQDRKVLVSFDEREVAYDQLVTIPLNMGADFVAASGLGDELNYVPVDRHTLIATGHDDIFALGDASNIPTSKAGSVAHFSVEVFVENFLEHVAGRPMTHRFDGHANCFVESGHGKALLLDFNYDTEPLTGTFPLPKVGPMTLLGESRANHLGKLAFRHVYWNALLPGRPIGLPAAMSMAGKNPA